MIRRSSAQDRCVKIESPAEWVVPQQTASTNSAATGAGERRPGSQGLVLSTDNTIETIERVVAPAAIERALSIYRQLQKRDWSVVVQARKILTQQVYAMIDQGEDDEHRLTVGALVYLKSVERDHAIRSASDSQKL